MNFVPTALDQPTRSQGVRVLDSPIWRVWPESKVRVGDMETCDYVMNWSLVFVLFCFVLFCFVVDSTLHLCLSFSFFITINLSTFLYLSSLSLYLSLYLYLSLHPYLFFCSSLCICFALCPSLHLSVCMSVYSLSLSLSLSLFLSHFSTFSLFGKYSMQTSLQLNWI